MQKVKKYGVLGGIILLLIYVFTVWRFYALEQNILWDEGFSLLWGYKIYEALRSGDLNPFWARSLEQTFHPPLFSWFTGGISFLLGFTLAKIKLYLLFWVAASAILLYCLGRQLSKPFGKTIGILAVFFFLSSPMTVILGGMPMKEMMGVALSLFFVFFYFKARKSLVFHKGLILGAVLFLLFFLKYNYAVLIAIAVLGETVISFLFWGRKGEVFKLHFSIFLTGGILILFWVLYPVNKIPQIIGVLSNLDPFTTGLTDIWGYVLFYPRAIIYLYTFSPLIGCFILISIFGTIFYFKDFRIRLLWLGVVINLAIGVRAYWNTQERYIFTTVPFLYLIGAYFLVKINGYLKSKVAKNYYRVIFPLTIILLVYLLGRDLVKLPFLIYGAASYTLKSPVYNQKDYRDLWFEYDTSKWAKEVGGKTSEKPQEAVDFILSEVDLAKRVILVGHTNELSPDYLEVSLLIYKEKEENKKVLPFSEFIVTYEVFPNSRFYTREYVLVNSWQLGQVEQIKQDKSLVLLGQKDFNEMGTRVIVYGRK